MKNILKSLALVLLLQGCYSGNVRSLSPRDKMEIRIENNYWLTAKVFEATQGATTRMRIATVDFGSRVTIRRRIGSTFRFLVAFIGGREIWASETWSSQEECLELTINSPLVFSSVYPCMGGPDRRRR